MIFNSIKRFLFASGLLFCCIYAQAQHQIGNSRISGDFGFNGMYYIPDSIIGAEPVDSKVRGNAFLNILYSNFVVNISFLIVPDRRFSQSRL